MPDPHLSTFVYSRHFCGSLQAVVTLMVQPIAACPMATWWIHVVSGYTPLLSGNYNSSWGTSEPWQPWLVTTKWDDPPAVFTSFSARYHELLIRARYFREQPVEASVVETTFSFHIFLRQWGVFRGRFRDCFELNFYSFESFPCMCSTLLTIWIIWKHISLCVPHCLCSSRHFSRRPHWAHITSPVGGASGDLATGEAFPGACGPARGFLVVQPMKISLWWEWWRPVRVLLAATNWRGELLG